MSLTRPVVAALIAFGAINTHSEELANADGVRQHDWIQVLLQGKDAQLLRETLTHYGGVVTHYLPIVDGIGGKIRAAHVGPMRSTPGVDRIVEDFNPPVAPAPRECLLDGALEAEITQDALRWRLFNFSPQSLPLVDVEVDWPAGLTPSSIVKPKTIPPGGTVLELRFQSSFIPNQNDFNIVVISETCSTKLVPAYPDNAGDFYYSTVTGADRLHARGITGRGVNVAVVDSGLWEAPYLALNTEGKNRVIARYDARLNQAFRPTKDASGHGSHMSSVIAHSERTAGKSGFKGVAPDAGLIPVKVFDAKGNGDFLDILRGIQWVVKNRERYDIRVMNMSLAAAPRFPYWDDPINQAVLKAWQAGIVVVAAAGNEGPDWGSIGSPGNNPYVITVGAVTDSWTASDFSDDYIPDFSSRGPTDQGHLKPDLVAPGGHMTGIIPKRSTMANDNPNWFLRSGEFVSTGSSQAAAAVSGVAALILQYDSALTNDQVKCILMTSAKPAINRDGRLSYSPFAQGAGYVDAVRAVTQGQLDCDATVGLDVNAAVAGTEQLYGAAEIATDGSPTLPGAIDLVAGALPPKGASSDRRWGVKAHVERLAIDKGESTQDPSVPVDWASVYEAERLRVQQLQETEHANH